MKMSPLLNLLLFFHVAYCAATVATEDINTAGNSQHAPSPPKGEQAPACSKNNSQDCDHLGINDFLEEAADLSKCKDPDDIYKERKPTLRTFDKVAYKGVKKLWSAANVVGYGGWRVVSRMADVVFKTEESLRTSRIGRSNKNHYDYYQYNDYDEEFDIFLEDHEVEYLEGVRTSHLKELDDAKEKTALSA